MSKKGSVIIFVLTALMFFQVTTRAEASIKGKVLETLTGGGYTYVLVQGRNGDVWAAGPQAVKVKKGDTVEFPEGAIMNNFTSKTLNRTFERIFFVREIKVVGSGSAQAPSSEGGSDKTETVENLLTKSEEYKGKTIQVRGKVTKFASGIMGKNFVHLEDGTGKSGTNDLILTTQQTVTVGDIVIAQGKYVTDRDFGMGYFYKIIIEETSFTKE